MIRIVAYLALILLAIQLTGCASKNVTERAIIQDADWYMSEGVQAFAESDWDGASLFFTRSLALYEGIDDQQGILNSLVNLSEVALSSRDYITAQKHLGRAAVIVNTALLQQFQPRISLVNAEIALQQKKYIKSERFLQLLLPDFDEPTPLHDLDRLQLLAIAKQTRIAFGRGQDESIWTQRFAEALQKSALNIPNLEARLLRFQAGLLQQQKKVKEAESYYHKALENYKDNFSRSGIAATLAELGKLYNSQSRWKQARQYLKRSNGVYRYLGNSEKITLNTEILIKVEAEIGNLEAKKMLNNQIENQ